MSIAEPIMRWFRSHGRDLPWRGPGFSAWGTMVSEFMLQQTPVARVVPRLELWLERWPTPSALASSPAADAVRAWDRLGYPRRALYLHGSAVLITERHGGVVPADVEVLLALPGVGEYTARAIAAFAYGRRHPVVDTNVRRVLSRAVDGVEPGAPRVRADLAAMAAVLPEDEAAARLTNAAVMELGALVCTARAPACGQCPIRDRCRWRAAGYPPAQQRRPVQKRYEGSDRQARGVVLGALRAATAAVPLPELAPLWPDAAQLHRALDGLRRDGLIRDDGEGGYLLPA